MSLPSDDLVVVAGVRSAGAQCEAGLDRALVDEKLRVVS